MYQTEWQNIQFSDFSEFSETELAGASFYNAFYHELFRRYRGFDELPETWRKEKKALAAWIANQLEAEARVLSVGCGLGYMEACLHQEYKRIELHVSDYATGAFKWLFQVLPEKRIHLDDGAVNYKPYDLIYLSAVDYAISTDQMVDMMENYRKLLATSGSCLIISASYLEENLPRGMKLKVAGKEFVKILMRQVGIYRKKRGQFWGWQRTRSEYQELILKSGYARCEDGFIETPHQKIYFIKGFSHV